MLKQSIFDYMQATARSWCSSRSSGSSSEKQLTTYRHDGFWACMDTFKEKQILEDLYTQGHAAVAGLEEARAEAASGTVAKSAGSR